MAAPRASIFDEDEIDISGFAPKLGPDASAPPPEQVRAVAVAANFRSRESPGPAPAAAKRPPRRHRTGRNVQFNVKASQNTVDAFYAISDRQGWVLGETLEHALAALQRELGEPGRGGADDPAAPA
jgi:hypothetical protein